MALGLTLIYGVLHIVNFAHGSLLMVAMFGAWLLATRLGSTPTRRCRSMTAIMFAVGWALYACVIGRVSGGDDRAILLATLGVSIVLDNRRTGHVHRRHAHVETRPHVRHDLDLGPAAAVGCHADLVRRRARRSRRLLWAFMARTDTGRAIRAVAREPDGARLVGIRPERIFALAYGIGIACLGAAACLLLPTFYVVPGVGNVFVLVAFTIVVLGGMGSFPAPSSAAC